MCPRALAPADLSHTTKALVEPMLGITMHLAVIAAVRVGGGVARGGAGARLAPHRLAPFAARAALSSSAAASLRRTGVRKLLDADEGIVGERVLVKGWVRTVRDQKTLSFIEVNDGSCLKGLQIVAEAESIAGYADIMGRIGTGASISAVGTVVRSKGKGQLYEIQATEIEVIGECDDTYPLQKKRHSLEFLRSIAHLRARTNTIGAISRVRSVLAQATHAFFAKEEFVYVQTPLVTSSDCEGAGEMFRVSTLPAKVSELPKTADGEIDYAEDFFGKPAFLTVSGQLAAEAYACALGSVYTFGAPPPRRATPPSPTLPTA
jgi:asparaginyl-tRNA synthetase